jgi:Tfp pilus assembly protein PilF
MNSVQLELVKLDKQWYREVKKNPDTPLFVCLGEKHELNLFDTYCKYQISEQASTQDIFLIHYQDFNNPATYGQSLIKEWKEAYHAWKEGTPEVPEWNEPKINTSEYKTDACKTANTLKDLYTLFPHLEGRKIFLHLAPINTDNVSMFELWLKEWCSVIKRKDIKILITDHHEFRSYKNLPDNRREFRVEIDIHNLMQNTASQTNRNKGSAETNYQQQLLIASNFLSKHKNEEALAALEKAVKIARFQQLPEAECTARLMMAQTFNVMKKEKEASLQFQKAIETAGDHSFIGAQMYMNYGGFLLSRSKTREAIECFEKTVEIGEKLNNDFIRMEGNRLIGQLKESKLSNRSVPYYEKCIEIGKKMPEDMRKQSSLSYTAGLLLKKYGSHSEQGKQLDQEMISLVGEDWKLLSQEPSAPKK